MAFCPTGEGGGVDNSCSAYGEAMKGLPRTVKASLKARFERATLESQRARILGIALAIKAGTYKASKNPTAEEWAKIDAAGREVLNKHMKEEDKVYKGVYILD